MLVENRITYDSDVMKRHRVTMTLPAIHHDGSNLVLWQKVSSGY
jgi:hypothetical protein